MKNTALLAALAALLIANQSAYAQGALTPPGAPAESQKSLQEIWDKLVTLSQKIESLPTVVRHIIPVPGMVEVLGGILPQGSELAGQAVSAFYIGRYEVTWEEWKLVRTWALANGYSDLENAGFGSWDNHPVQNVSWFDVVKWCNAKSEMEGLTPVYYLNETIYKVGQATISVDYAANGYRLPLEREWEWAARGGIESQGYIYSGSNNVNEVAWCEENSSDGTKAVGTKSPNELGIYDMSGNVWEWCLDYLWTNRRFRGGSWGFRGEACEVAMRFYGFSEGPELRMLGYGFRIARNAP